MNQIDETEIDLNLLKTLDALLDERSVTRAARRLGVGQPAASHGLARLRELFGDPLLVRVGRRMIPTPRAEALHEPLKRLLGDATRLVQQEPAFEPSTTTRTFAMLCPDLLAPILPRIVRRLHAAAPGARLEVLGRQAGESGLLETGRADLALTPALDQGVGLVRRGLPSVHFAVAARRDHPAVKRARRLHTSTWAAFPHVMVRSGHGGRSIVGEALEAAGFERRIGLIVPTFLAALVAVSETDFFFAVPRELARPVVDCLGLKLFRPPLEIPDVPVTVVWHERYSADPAHQFFRELVRDELTKALG